MARGLDKLALQQTIAAQIRQAAAESGSGIAAQRADLFDAYMAEPYGDETEDRSQVVSSDVADTIEWIMPELMDLFSSSDRLVGFRPVGPEDEEAADQETETVSHVFWVENPGFEILYNFVKDGLVQKVGYVKRHWEERERTTVEEYDGLTPDEWQGLLARWESQGWDVEVLRMEGADLEAVGGEGLEIVDQSISVEVRLTRVEGREVVESVPPEEVLVSPRWNKVCLDGCPFVAHRRRMTVSDLIELGYDRKQVERLPDADGGDYENEERTERFDTIGSSEAHEDEPVDPSMREVLVHECYLYADHDGDGKAELRRVTVGGPGHEILRWADGGEDNEEVEVQPFSAWCPIPIPHRHYGRSVAELITDLQRVKTVLTRQLLDNIYLTNNPTREIAEPGLGEQTLADLLVERPGKIVRTAVPGMYQEHSPPVFAPQLLQVIEYVDTLRENRSGVTRYNQGLDAQSLNKTATGISKLLSSSQKKIMLYARMCAEVGLKHLFQGIHGDLRRHGSKAMTIRLRGSYVEVDPRSWAERADMTVHVGIGSGDREIRMAFLERIIAEIKEHILAGSPMADLGNLFNAYERYIANAGFKNPEAFFQRPQPGQEGQPQGGQQQGDPIAAAAQIEMMKVQAQAQEAAQKLALEEKKLALEDDRERDRLNMELAMKLAEISAKSQTTLTVEQIKQMAAELRALNQPPGVAA